MKVCLKITLLLLALLFAGGGVAHVSAQIDKDVVIPKKSTVPRSSPPKKAAKQQNKPKSKPVSKPQIQPPSQEPSKGAKTEDLGMIINGVLWATRNVDEPGTFAASPESAGKFYQWNRKKAWPATGSVSNWDSNDPAGDTWSRANDPSPKGYRLPTSTEIDKLLDGSKVSNEWTEVNGVNGRKFTDKATGASIFLPAAGYRCLIDGSFRFVGSHGHYWSSTGYDSYYAYLLLFHSNNASLDFSLRSDGFSVRPVAEIQPEVVSPANSHPVEETPLQTQAPVKEVQAEKPAAEKKALPTDRDDGVVINGVLWATRNVDEPGTFASSPESAGKFYQWNRKIAWPTTGSVSNWDSSYPAGDTWAKENDPSPSGWRVPTDEEIEKLLDKNKVSNQWTKVNGVNGRKFTDKATGASIFLPAAGYRSGRNYGGGSLGDVGGYGYYWSSTGNVSYGAYVLYFNSDDANLGGYDRRYGLSVRPVAE